MVDRDLSPEAGGNTDQADDGRDPLGRLPEPLDAAHYGQAADFEINLPGMPLSQPAGTGPVLSTPPPAPEPEPQAEPQAEPADDAPPPAETAASPKRGGMTTMPRAGG